MAEKFNAAISEYFPENEPFSCACALFFYTHDSEYRYITMDLKYNGALKTGRHFARELGGRIARCGWFADLDLLVPVPLHPMRRWKRGYNQAEVIAREVSDGCRGIPVEPSLLRRTRRTRTQTALSVEEKKANVEGVFAVNEKVLEELVGKRGSLPGHIAIIDDVFTTGATAAQCWRALRAKLPPSVKISVITLAFVD